MCILTDKTCKVSHGLVIRLGHHLADAFRKLPGDLKHVGQLEVLVVLALHLGAHSSLDLVLVSEHDLEYNPYELLKMTLSHHNLRVEEQ